MSIRSIILKLEGGLGNQFYQYATGLALSKKHGVPLYILERSDSPNDPRRHSHLGLFSCHYKSVSGLEKVLYQSFFIKKWGIGKFSRKHLAQLFAVSFVSDPETGFFPNILENKSGKVFLRGYWQSYKYFEFLLPELRKAFTLSFSPSDQRNQEYLDLIQNSESVAVHIRRGDYEKIQFFRENFGLCSLDYYKRSMEHMESLLVNPSFFVFSDDPDWVKKNLSFDFPVYFVSHNLGVQDFEDFRLMKSCKHFVLANSSYSWWAAWLGDFTDKIVVAPNPWFIKDAMPFYDRIPQEWIVMRN